MLVNLSISTRVSPDIKIGMVFVDLSSVAMQEKHNLIKSFLNDASQVCATHDLQLFRYNLSNLEEKIEVEVQDNNLKLISDIKKIEDVDCQSVLILIASFGNQDHLVIKNASVAIAQDIEHRYTVPVQINLLDLQNHTAHIHFANNSKEHLVRLEKVEKLRAMGIEPWPDNIVVKNKCLQVLEEFSETNSKEYILAGRVMNIRLHGKAAFFIIQDDTERLQVYIKTDVIGENKFKFFENFIDLGDIVWVKGSVFKTKTGQISLNIAELILLSKCLYPLPEKFHGLIDVEIKYRQRYLDLMTNEKSKERFIKRSQIVSAMRNYLDSHGYIEVETPMLHPIAGGAAAKPFVTHHNALGSDFYLRIAPELYLKRLVVGGLDKVYEINRNFRNEGISTRHNPEFTMLEFYTAYQDYKFSIEFVKSLLQNIALKICGTLQLQYGDMLIDFEKFEILSVHDSVVRYCNLKNSDLHAENIDKTLKNLNIKSSNISIAQKIYSIFEEHVESKLINPTFIIDYPIEISPLAKKNTNNPTYAPRYELFIAGMEISNSYNELNDPLDQAERFSDQVKEREAGNSEAHSFDADFIKCLEYGLPPTVGVGIGIDRLVMILTNTTSIKEVILFPTLKKVR